MNQFAKPARSRPVFSHIAACLVGVLQERQLFERCRSDYLDPFIQASCRKVIAFDQQPNTAELLEAGLISRVYYPQMGSIFLGFIPAEKAFKALNIRAFNCPDPETFGKELLDRVFSELRINLKKEGGPSFGRIQLSSLIEKTGIAHSSLVQIINQYYADFSISPNSRTLSLKVSPLPIKTKRAPSVAAAERIRLKSRIYLLKLFARQGGSSLEKVKLLLNKKGPSFGVIGLVVLEDLISKGIVIKTFNFYSRRKSIDDLLGESNVVLCLAQLNAEILPDPEKELQRCLQRAVGAYIKKGAEEKARALVELLANRKSN